MPPDDDSDAESIVTADECPGTGVERDDDDDEEEDEAAPLRLIDWVPVQYELIESPPRNLKDLIQKSILLSL